MAEAQRLTRSETDRVLGGVAGGIAEHYGLDPTLVRIGFVLFAVFGGSGVVLYLALWLIIPRASKAQLPSRDTVRDSVSEMKEAAQRLAGDVRSGWRGPSSSNGTPTDGTPTQPPTTADEPTTVDLPHDDLTDA